MAGEDKFLKEISAALKPRIIKIMEFITATELKILEAHGFDEGKLTMKQAGDARDLCSDLHKQAMEMLEFTRKIAVQQGPIGGDLNADEIAHKLLSLKPEVLQEIKEKMATHGRTAPSSGPEQPSLN